MNAKIDAIQQAPPSPAKTTPVKQTPIKESSPEKTSPEKIEPKALVEVVPEPSPERKTPDRGQEITPAPEIRKPVSDFDPSEDYDHDFESSYRNSEQSQYNLNSGESKSSSFGKVKPRVPSMKNPTTGTDEEMEDLLL